MSANATEHTIAVIGAGFTGTAVTCNLLALAKESNSNLKVILIGDPTTFGGGLAYRVEDDNLVLNVPIGNMSAFADRPNDFLDFCQRIDSALISGSFVSRRLYGQYLASCLAQARASSHERLFEIEDRVMDVVPKGDRFRLQLQSTDPIVVDRVVLAFGHQPPTPLENALGPDCFLSAPVGEDATRSPEACAPLHRLSDHMPVLIVGTGHTAIDTLFRLTSHVPERKVFMVSRHGFLPGGHRNAGEFVRLPHLKEEVERSIHQILTTQPKIRLVLSQLRRIAAVHSANGGNWRDVINSLRSITPDIWKALSDRERHQFLRHVVSYWDALRHRLAPVATGRVAQLLGNGRAEVIAGRIQQIQRLNTDELCVTVTLRKRKGTRTLTVGSVVNCTGPTYDIQKTSNALVHNLRISGLLCADVHRLGIEVDEHYRCSDLPTLHYVGPMLRAKHWEATAVPELRLHAFELARQVNSAHLQTRGELRNGSSEPEAPSLSRA